MQTVKASAILQGAARLMRWDTDALEEEEKQDLREAFSQALQDVWEAWWWSELMQCKPQILRETYNAATHGDGAIEVIGAGASEVNGIYIASGFADYYTRGDRPDCKLYRSDGATGSMLWSLDSWLDMPGVGEHYFTRYYAFGDVGFETVPAWQIIPPDPPFGSPGVGPAPTVCLAGAVCSPEIPWAGCVRSVSRLDPRVTRNPGDFEFSETEFGIRISDLSVLRPWIWYRRVTPVITADDYDATASYEATAAADLVFDS